MIDGIQERLQDNTALRQAMLVLLAVGLGAAGGLAIVAGNPVVPFAVVAALVALPWLVTRPVADLMLSVATITLLPFAALPVRLAVLTPTLLEVALVLLYVAWFLRALLRPDERMQRTPVDGWLLVFLGSTLFSFVLGLSRDLRTDVIHNYVKLILSIGIFFAATNLLRTPRLIGLALRSLIVLGGIAAAVGVVLWRLPDTLAAALLGRLRVVGYPTDRIIRYVEDNPALGERAVGTQVDPNSFGGLLVVIAVVTGVALLARRPVLPRWLLGGLFLVDMAALVLTNSRSALVGVVAAGALVATLRYRRLWVWGVAGAVVIAALGVGSGYFARLASGLRFEDQASLMRLAEYRNAIDIIGRYPAFGVGFGTAGELDLTTGVSSIYLTVAERAGLLGLALFLVTVFALLAAGLAAVRRSASLRDDPRGAGERDWPAVDTALLGGTAALFGTLAVGLVDHYYFNIEFPHMAALFWLVAGTVMAARALVLTPASAPGIEPAAPAGSDNRDGLASSIPAARI
jgi:O-antigen ligase